MKRIGLCSCAKNFRGLAALVLGSFVGAPDFAYPQTPDGFSLRPPASVNERHRGSSWSKRPAFSNTQQQIAIQKPISERAREAARLIREKRYAEAERRCLDAIQYNAVVNKNAAPIGHVRELLADIYLKQGRLQEATSAYELLARNTSSSTLRHNLGLAYVRSGNVAAARRLFNPLQLQGHSLKNNSEELKLLPGVATAQSTEASLLLALGLTHYMGGAEPEAVEYLDQAAKLAPNNVLIHYWAGSVKVSSDIRKYGEAVKHLEFVMANHKGKLADDAKGVLRDARNGLAYQKRTGKM